MLVLTKAVSMNTTVDMEVARAMGERGVSLGTAGMIMWLN